MPTIFTHAAVPLALGVGSGRQAVNPRLLAAGVVASMLPDIDVLGFRLHVAYADAFGHRGFTHSLAFALLAGLMALMIARLLRTSRAVAFTFITVSTLSHGLLDMLTNGGHGVALWWPLTTERLFWPVHPVEASPLSVHRLVNGRGWDVVHSELLWIWLPTVLACGTLVVLRKARRRPRDAGGQIIGG